MKSWWMSVVLAWAVVSTGVGRAEDNFQREGTGERREAKNAIEGKAPPELKVEKWLNTDGKAPSLDDFKGKVVVIDFWGVWCPPCRKAMPHLKELYHRHREQGLVVIGIHTTNDGEKAADFVTQEKLDWPIAVDVKNQTTSAFRVDSYPDYYLIDRSGKLRVADLSNGDLDKAPMITNK